MGSPYGHGFGEPIGGPNERLKTVGKKPTRGLLADAPAPEATKTTWIHKFITDPVDGGFTVNVLAGFFVHVALFIATILGTCLCYRRARRRERLARYYEGLKHDGRNFAMTTLLESMVVGSLSSLGTPPAAVLQAKSSTAQSSSSAPPPVAENHAKTTVSMPAGSTPGSPTCSTNAVPPTGPKKADQTTERPCDQLQQRKLNVYPIRSRSRGHATNMSSESPPVATPPPDVVAKDHHVVDIPISCRFPSLTETKEGNKFKETVKEKLGVAFEQDVCSSRMLHGRVPATEESLRALREVAIEGMKLDKGFTLQIGASFMYCCTGNPEEPVLLSLRDVEVPTVLQAEYSAGMLIVRGRYLEGAEIRAATSEGYMVFASVKQAPIDDEDLPEERIGTWRCTDLLPPVKLDQILIFASKRVHIEGQSVLVRSELRSIQDTTLKTVIYKWVPTIIITSILASQLWTILALLSKLVTNRLHHLFSYPTLALAMYIIQQLLPSLEENVNSFIERVKLAISSFHVFPKPLATPTFFMHDGSCFQRGARYLIYPRPPPPKLEGHDEQSHKQEEGNLVTKMDWKWPCSRINQITKIRENFDADSNDYGSNSTDNLPFEVLYGQECFSDENIAEKSGRHKKSQYIPKDMTIKLYSKHLQNLVRKCSHNNMKQFESYGEIQAKDLLILYLNGKLPEENYASWSNLPSTSENEHERHGLHMFHLIRFLKKEYANTIKQHDRMMKAGIISWDMLWTLIVPGIDVIYYCEVSNQELCGNVMTVNYNFDQRKPPGFFIDLEVHDFDCTDFVASKVLRRQRVFSDDVKIINLEVFPLQCKSNPQESEDSLFKRGRTFCDLVLRYERQFMQYSGLMYETAYKGPDDPAYRKKRGHSFKASIDGRVMIDQKWFAKLKPRRDMGTASAKGWNPMNERSEMRTKAAANKFDSLLKYSPAIAYGYSFSLRKWGCFNITGFSKIEFVSTAFEKLVMKEENKLALITLTEYYVNNTRGIKNVATHIDILPNKGQGCTIVLHGPPGTGKTVTVESLAERLGCPLWQLSISKLTASTKRLENKMLSTLEVAKSWGAILVLDEADVYLTARKYSPLSSNNTRYNAMTGVFLRVLEHYEGVLFLTTNAMNIIDPAIFSRISLFIKYGKFDEEERKKLWSNFLEECKISDLSEDFWNEVLPVQFNGREIRNIVQSAQIFIQSKRFGTDHPEECVLRAFDAMTNPSTMHFLVDSQEADRSSPEVAPPPEVAPSMGSAPALSYTSD